jgi:hypothetical protein
MSRPGELGSHCQPVQLVSTRPHLRKDGRNHNQVTTFVTPAELRDSGRSRRVRHPRPGRASLLSNYATNSS